jgi:hypothetical protein
MLPGASGPADAIDVFADLMGMTCLYQLVQVHN